MTQNDPSFFCWLFSEPFAFIKIKADKKMIFLCLLTTITFSCFKIN